MEERLPRTCPSCGAYAGRALAIFSHSHRKERRMVCGECETRWTQYEYGEVSALAVFGDFAADAA